MEVKVYNIDGSVIDTRNIELKVKKPSDRVVYDAYINELANRRQGSASTKTRAEVRGGGKKPWRQKGTGRARHGSIRSPQWRGGGIVFGPKPRDYGYKLPKKIKHRAYRRLFIDLLEAGRLFVIEDIVLSEAKTKAFLDGVYNLLKPFIDSTDKKWKDIDKIKRLRATFIVSGKREDIKLLKLATRNLPGINVLSDNHLDFNVVFLSDYVFMDSSAFDFIKAKYLEEGSGEA